jgi:hypothetical protein
MVHKLIYQQHHSRDDISSADNSHIDVDDSILDEKFWFSNSKE